MKNTQAVYLTDSVVRTAHLISEGGSFFYDDLTRLTEVHRDTLDKALATLNELGALTYTLPAKGRPTTDSRGSFTDITIHADNWVWAALRIEMK